MPDGGNNFDRRSSVVKTGTGSKLQELYLRKNDIRDIADVHYLRSIRSLRVLWLAENPCAAVENYRRLVIRALPQLEKLDNEEVTADERSSASAATLPPVPTPSQSSAAAVGATPSEVRTSYQRPEILPITAAPPLSNASTSSVLSEISSSTGSAAPAMNVAAEPPPRPAKSPAGSHVLAAILLLLNELQPSELEVLHRDIERRRAQMQNLPL